MNSMFTKITRIALGLILILFGANKFLHFIPMEAPTGIAGEFMNSLVGFLEVIIGIMLLAKKWVAFALVLLAPISINILLFHLFLAIPGLGIAIVVLALNFILIYKHWQQYKPLFY
jgi:putative oxidoreductase